MPLEGTTAPFGLPVEGVSEKVPLLQITNVVSGIEMPGSTFTVIVNMSPSQV